MNWFGAGLLAVTLGLSGCGSSVSEQSPPIEYYEPDPAPDDFLPEESFDDSFSGDCDPNYDGACVPLVDFDLDCPDVEGPVYVIGTDVHGFDRDGDGVGCEPYP